MDDLPCRALAGIIDIALVRKAKHTNLCATEALFEGGKFLLKELHGIARHSLVYLSRKDEKIMDKSPLFCLCDKIIRIDRDAMASNASSRIMGKESERFC